MMAGRIREYAFCRTMDSLHNNHPNMQETMQSVKETTELRQWFVMRDLKRGNAKQPAYKLLGELKSDFYSDGVEIENSSGQTCSPAGSFYARFVIRL